MNILKKKQLNHYYLYVKVCNLSTVNPSAFNIIITKFTCIYYLFSDYLILLFLINNQ